jgi:hypothetical protein
MICPLMLFALTWIGTSTAIAAINSRADAAPPFLFHQQYLLNQPVSSWTVSPAHPAATAAVATYPAISQQDKEAVNELMDASAAMDQYAKREAVVADVLALALGVAVIVRLTRFMRRLGP